MNQTPQTGGVAPPLSDRVRALRLPKKADRRSGGGVLPWLLVLMLLGAVGYLGYRDWERSKASPEVAAASTSEAKPGASESKPAGASTPAEAPKPGSIALESKGYIIAKHQITVSPKVAGVIEKFFIEEGKFVKKGEPLCVLETDDYRFERDRAQALYDQAKAKLEEMENGSRLEEKEQANAEKDEAVATMELNRLTHERNKRLRQSTVVATAEVEQSDASLRAMAARVKKLANNAALVEIGPRKERIAAARAELNQAKADLDRSKWRLDNCTVRAPVTGTVLKKAAELGNMVNTVAFTGSTSICDLADLADLEVDLSIQERDFARIFDGQECEIRPDAYPERVYKGVARRMPLGDRAKGAIPVRVTVRVPESEAGQYLRPDMGAVVSFLHGQSRSK